MREQVEKELETFNKIYQGADNQLVTLVLMDIMATSLNITKDTKGNIIRDYAKFNTLVDNIKEILENINEMPQIDIINNLKMNLEQNEKLRKECEYSMRTLSWILNDVIKEEK